MIILIFQASISKACPLAPPLTLHHNFLLSASQYIAYFTLLSCFILAALLNLSLIAAASSLILYSINELAVIQWFSPTSTKGKGKKPCQPVDWQWQHGHGTVTYIKKYLNYGSKCGVERELNERRSFWLLCLCASSPVVVPASLRSLRVSGWRRVTVSSKNEWS